MTPHEQIRSLVNVALVRGAQRMPAAAMPPKAIVVDIGANIGGFVSYFLEHGAAQVHAFEPVPWTFAELAHKFCDLGEHRVHMNQKAIGGHKARLENIRILNAHTLAPLGHGRLGTALEDRGPFAMDMITLDEYVFRTHKLARVDLIKLDVDGGEPAALRGMASTLEAFRPPIMLELSYLPRALGESCEGMIAWIYNRDYKICTMDSEVCDDVQTVMEAYPWRTSFDVMAMPSEKIGADWARVR